MEDLDVDTLLKPVYRPWYVYLMAIWAFFGIGGVSLSLTRYFAEGDPLILQVCGVAAIGFTIVLIVNIIRMKKLFLFIFGILCAMVAIWQGMNLLGALYTIGSDISIIIFFLFYIIPSIIMAILSLRPKFLSLAAKYSDYRNQESIRKIALKNVGKL